MKYAVEMGAGAMIYIAGLVKMVQIYRQTHRHR
jgi:hypothetical protein